MTKTFVADFGGKIGKREIAQGVLGSNSLIITLDDLKKIVTTEYNIEAAILISFN